MLIFLIDDLGRSDVQVDGSTFHETPRLDALAQSGVRFTSFYSNCPVCSPTRAALMTGKVPQRVGITDWIHPASGVALPAAETTLGEAFQAHGYQTAYLGKWHLGESDADQPTRHGFEWIQGVNRAGQPASYYFPFPPSADKSSDLGCAGLGSRQRGRLSDRCADESRHRVPEAAGCAAPFLLCLGHYAVHTPIEPPAGLPPKYRAAAHELYRRLRHTHAGMPRSARSRVARQDDADYAAMMENLDTNIGRVLDALEELRLAARTRSSSSHPTTAALCTLAGKQARPDLQSALAVGQGLAVRRRHPRPCFVAWPAGLQPATTDVPGLHGRSLSHAARAVRLAGRTGAVPRWPVAGQRPARDTGRALQERPLAWYYPHDHGSGHRAGAAIRHGKWKLVHYLASDQSELYDLASDPGESSRCE